MQNKPTASTHQQVTGALHNILRSQMQASHGSTRNRSNVSATQRNAELAAALQRAQRNL